MSLRVTGGFLRGRLIPSPKDYKTRPTASRTREALFNIIGCVEQFKVLDLFAGSGIIGIEAISRGAISVRAVEKSHSQGSLLLKAYKSLSIEDKLILEIKDALDFLSEIANNGETFDFIYADPPFKNMKYPDLRSFISLLNPLGVAVFETPSREIPLWATENENFQIRKYGESSLLIYQKRKT